MFTFKSFLKETSPVYGYNTLLWEELTKEQKDKVNEWGDGSAARAISSHVFPKDQDRMEIPLEMEQTPAVPHPGVQKHLEDNGYSISDYRGGFATDKYGRSVSIGKILNKTKAPDDITNAFMNDPQRAASSVAQPKIIISRHPHDVASMSTDRGWRSCMEMGGPNTGGGINQHFLEHDIRNGTHVAYLVRPEDNDIKKPMARIALKPFHSDDENVVKSWMSSLDDAPENWLKPAPSFKGDNPHTILRPESRVYGIGARGDDNDNSASGVDSSIVSSFKNTIKNWTSKNFPMKENTEYRKDQNVYNDDGKTVVMPFDKAMRSTNPKHIASAFEDHPEKITSEHIDKVLSSEGDNTYLAKVAALNHSLSTPEQVLKASHDPHENIKNAALKNAKLPVARLQDVIHNPHEDEYTRLAALKNPSVTSDILHHVLMDRNDELREDAIKHPNVSPVTLNELARSSHYKDSRLKSSALSHKNFTSVHIDNALNDPTIDSQSKQNMIKNNPNISSDHLNSIINGKNSTQGMINAAINHKKTSVKTVSDYLSNDDIHPSDKWEVLNKSPKINSKHIDTILNSSTKKPEWYSAEGELKEAAVRHHAASPETLDNIINNEKDENIRYSAVTNKNVKSETLDKLISNPEEKRYIKRVAINNPNTSSKTLLKTIDNGDDDPSSMASIMNHPNATQEHINAGMNSKNSKIRFETLASNSPHITKKHIIDAMGDEAYDVSSEAKNQAEWRLDPHDQIYAMSHPNPEVRRSMALIKNLSKEAHSMAVKDEDPVVRSYSVLSKHTTPKHIEEFHQDPDQAVRALSTISQHITPEHLTTLANDPVKTIRSAVARHEKTPESVRMNLAQNDPDENVRKEATANLKTA